MMRTNIHPRSSCQTRPALSLWLLLLAGPLAAQTMPASGVELRAFAGAYFPTGDEHDLLKAAVLLGAQTSYRIVPQFAITGSFAWTPSKDRITPGDQKLDVFQYDIGAELRAPSWDSGATWDVNPFVGFGLGGRTYSYRDLEAGSKTNFADYGAMGADLGFRGLSLRFEVRDYISRFARLAGNGGNNTRNDLNIAAGLRIRL